MSASAYFRGIGQLTPPRVTNCEFGARGSNLPHRGTLEGGTTPTQVGVKDYECTGGGKLSTQKNLLEARALTVTALKNNEWKERRRAPRRTICPKYPDTD